MSGNVKPLDGPFTWVLDEDTSNNTWWVENITGSPHYLFGPLEQEDGYDLCELLTQYETLLDYT